LNTKASKCTLANILRKKVIKKHNKKEKDQLYIKQQAKDI